MAMQKVMQTCQRIAFMNKHLNGRRNISLINFPKPKKESLHNSEFSHVLQLNISTYTNEHLILLLYSGKDFAGGVKIISD